MNAKRILIALVVLNGALLTFLFAQDRRNQGDASAPVLRGRALELVDDQGRVRAEIRVLPAQPLAKMPDGTTGFPEAVQLRLIDSKNGPNVKLVATEDGAGLVLGSEAGAYVQVLSRDGNPFIKIVTKDGRQQVIKP